MKPVKFKESNKELQKPSDMTDKQCKPLPIVNIDNLCISLWQATFWERLKFVYNGKIWLTIRSGQTQPPVKLTFKKPFNDAFSFNENNGMHFAQNAVLFIWGRLQLTILKFWQKTEWGKFPIQIYLMPKIYKENDTRLSP